MHKFVRNLITEWRKLELPFSDETFIVAVSGGADSVSLLLALHDLKERKKLDLRFVVAHFNHNLRGAESDADEEFVKHLTTGFGFELALGHGKISHEGNLEQNARTARYAFLKQTAKNLNAYGVLTAHTMNDQAETFLMNLIRGSGVAGLSGMKAVRSFEIQVPSSKSEEKNLEPKTSNLKPFLIRPLLRWAKRIYTENFCRESEVEYRYDTMNEDIAFIRVRIRKILLPLLMDFNPNIVETLANTADLMRMSELPSLEKEGWPRFADGVVRSSHSDGLTSDEERTTPSAETASTPPVKGGEPESEPRAVTGVISDDLATRELKLLPKAELYRTLRKWLGSKRGNLRSLELKHIEAIERLILSRKSGKTVELPNGETVVKQNGKLEFVNIKVDN